MVNFAVVIATIATLAGRAIAAPPMGPTCNPGQQYCGYTLLNNKASTSSSSHFTVQVYSYEPG